MNFSTIKNKLSINSNRNKTFWLIIGVILVSSLIIGDVFAGNTDDPLGERLCKILEILMGPTAKAIATIAIIFVAIALFAGRMTWLTVIPIIIGVIVIFSAPALVVFIGGSGNTVCTNT